MFLMFCHSNGRCSLVWFSKTLRIRYSSFALRRLFLHKFRNVSTLKLEKYFNKESKEKCAEWRKDAKWRLLMNHSEDAIRRIQKLFFLIICTSACPCALSVYRTMHAQKMILHNTFIVHIYMWANTVMTMNSSFNCLIFFWSNWKLRGVPASFVPKLFRRERICVWLLCDYDWTYVKTRW